MTNKELMSMASEARKFSYSPYSHFRVGSALLAKNGKVYTGCNVENAGYTPTNCAERTAVFKAVSEGVTEFERIAIVAGKDDEISGFCPPCGVCRQVLSEFCDGDFILVLGNEKEFKEYKFKDIMPYTFTDKDL